MSNAAKNKKKYTNSGTSVILADKQWLLSLLPNVKIRKILSYLRVKELNSTIHNIDKYILILIYLSGLKKNDNKALACIIKKIHLISNLKTNLLIKNNIIEPEKIMLNVSRNEARINSYNIIIKIITHNAD